MIVSFSTLVVIRGCEVISVVTVDITFKRFKGPFHCGKTCIWVNRELLITKHEIFEVLFSLLLAPVNYFLHLSPFFSLLFSVHLFSYSEPAFLRKQRCFFGTAEPCLVTPGRGPFVDQHNGGKSVCPLWTGSIGRLSHGLSQTPEFLLNLCCVRRPASTLQLPLAGISSALRSPIRTKGHRF